MDNDDNDYQGQSLHIVDEERTKISSVLRPYALPKFDFDDSLQVHLRFDSLVENEVFLGIPSQEENHWIEDFSRGSSGIEFSSSAAESCSIPRRINVWSEATSSESVEMLLKSVGQEEIVRGESVIEESGVCDELGSSEKKMEPSLRQDEKMDDQDSNRALSATELLKNASVVDQYSGAVDIDVEHASDTQEIEHSASELPAVGLIKDGSGVDQVTGGVDVYAKHASETQETEHSAMECSGADIDNSMVLTDQNVQTNVHIDSESHEKVDTSLTESFKNGARELLINSDLQGDTELCSQNIIVDVGSVSVQDKVSDKHLKGASNHQEEENCEVVKGESLQNSDSNVNDESMSKSVAHIPVINNGPQPSIVSKIEAAEACNIETNVAKFDDSSSFPQSEESVLGTIGGNNEDLHSIVMGFQNPVALAMSKTIETKESIDKCEKSLVTSQGDEVETFAIMRSGVEAHCVHADPEVAEGSLVQTSHGPSSHIKAEEICAVSHSAMVGVTSEVGEGPLVETSHGASSHIKAEEICDVSHSPMDVVTAETASDPYMSEGDCVVHHQVTANSISHTDDLPSLTRTPRTAEFVAVVQKSTEDNVASGIHGDFVPTVQTGMQIPEGDISSDKIDTFSCKQNVSGDIRNADSDAVRLVHDAERASSSSLVEEVRENVDPPPGFKLDNSVTTGSVSDGGVSDANLLSVGTPDANRQLSLIGGASEEVAHSNKEQESSSHAVLPIGVYKQEELRVGVPSETHMSSLKESLGVESEPHPVSAGEKGTFGSIAAELVIKGDQSVEGEISNTVSQDVGGVADKRASEDESSERTKVDPVHSGSKLPELRDAGSAATEEHQGQKKEGNEEANPEASGGGNYAETENSHGSTRHIHTNLSETTKGAHEGPIEAVLNNVVPSVKGEVGAETVSTPASVGVGGSSTEEKSFTFDVRPVAVPPEGETGIGCQSFPNIKACKMPMVEKGSAAKPSKSQKENKAVHDASHAIPRATESGSVSSGARNTSERKLRRGSGKAGKDSKKGEKELPGKQPERGDKQNASVSPLGAGQLLQFEVGNAERSSAKPTIVSIPSSNLPDLNSSVPTSALFHQPFTDSQQVQLRAQIFVYGSLIQGAPPDEACMVSAFGTSDGGRNVWESSWRACVERLHGHKSIANNDETPVQTRPGSKARDHSGKQGLTQSKALPSPASQLSSKTTPFAAVNPIIPLSSPLWNISTPSCVGLPSSSVARGAVLDYQALPPLHPYQSPPVRTFGGPTTSWLSQAPFPGPWVAPQSSPFDFSARISSLSTTETVKLTPAKDPSLAISSTAKHVSSTSVGHGGVSSTLSGTPPSVDVKKMSGTPGQHSTEPKSRKRKKNSISEDPIHTPLAAMVTEALSSPVISGHSSKKGHAIELGPVSLLARNQNESTVAPVISGHFSTSVAVTASPSCVPKSDADKVIVDASPALLSTDDSKRFDIEQIGIHAETLSKVEEAKRQADEAASHAAAAVSQCQSVWSQLDEQRNSGLTPGIEEKLASAAVAIAAAASVAKAAAAAAKIASSAALQAKQMADEASLLKGMDDSKTSGSIISAAKEAARKRIEAAEAASRHAENLDAIVKAAELAAEAVSQAGVVVAMGEPLPLSMLVEAGPNKYWKKSEIPSGHAVKHSTGNGDKINTKSFKDVPKQSEGPCDQVMHTTSRSARNMVEDNVRIGEDTSASVGHIEKGLSGKSDHRESDPAKAIRNMPEPGNGSILGTQVNGASPSDDNGIKEGCLVEVFKDGGCFKGAWYSAKVLSLDNGMVFVCYTELQSDDGSGSLTEWVPLEEGNEVPLIRIPHPMSSISFEGTRKRRRAAVKDYNWSVGDRVDIWVEDCWREGVITEKNKKDQTSFTVHFPAQGETSVVKSWHLRPTLIWKDGEWIELPNSSQTVLSQSDTPQDKRQKLGSSTVEVKGKGRISVSMDTMGSEKEDESKLMQLSESEKVFNLGSKADAPRIMRSGLQKEGSKVIFGVPKPGKKRKFMEVSKHYVSEGTTKHSNANDSAKISKYLAPQGPGSRGWKNTSKIDAKEKHAAAESKSKVLKSGKLPTVSSRTLPQKEKSFSSSVATTHETTTKGFIVKDSSSKDANESGSENANEFGSNSNVDEPTDITTSSQDFPSNATKKSFTSAKSERLTKGKFVPAGGKSTKADVKDKPIPESVEPRRSNRKIQPTSRLLEGLQSSLIISKVPSVSYDKSHRSHNRVASRGTNNHG